MSKRLFSIQNKIALAIILSGLAGVAFFSFAGKKNPAQNDSVSLAQSSRSEFELTLEAALYTRTEFFGANAVVPFPTMEARDRLSALLDKYPNDARLYQKLAELDEHLGEYEKAEQELSSRPQLCLPISIQVSDHRRYKLICSKV